MEKWVLKLWYFTWVNLFMETTIFDLVTLTLESGLLFEYFNLVNNIWIPQNFGRGMWVCPPTCILYIYMCTLCMLVAQLRWEICFKLHFTVLTPRPRGVGIPKSHLCLCGDSILSICYSMYKLTQSIEILLILMYNIFHLHDNLVYTCSEDLMIFSQFFFGGGGGFNYFWFFQGGQACTYEYINS